MARPSPEERKRRDANKAKHAKSRDEAAKQEQIVRKRVEAILNDALSGSHDPGIAVERIDLVAKLEHHRLMALSCYPPQISAANSALFLQAKLLGLVVDQAAVVHANAGRIDMSGDQREVAERIFDHYREKIGSAKTKEVLGHLKTSGLLPKPFIELMAEEEEPDEPEAPE